jgi:hypothetical protein
MAGRVGLGQRGERHRSVDDVEADQFTGPVAAQFEGWRVESALNV